MEKMSRSESGKLGYIAAKKTIKEQYENRILNYNKKPNTCKNCNEPLPYTKRKYKYCTRSCAVTMNNSLHPKRISKYQNSCIVCDTKTNNKYYCTQACKNLHIIERYHDGLITGRKTLRNIILKETGNKCQMCGITQWNNIPITLEIDHINGNASNNMPNNLRLICPNCHSTTPSWKGRNRGNGRKSIGVPLH